jgi:hypothetical protein
MIHIIIVKYNKILLIGTVWQIGSSKVDYAKLDGKLDQKQQKNDQLGGYENKLAMLCIWSWNLEGKLQGLSMRA